MCVRVCVCMCVDQAGVTAEQLYGQLRMAEISMDIDGCDSCRAFIGACQGINVLVQTKLGVVGAHVRS